MANVGSYLNNASNASRYTAFFDEGNFYTSQRKTLCLFNTAPCTQSSENFNTFEIKIEKGYYLINLNKD